MRHVGGFGSEEIAGLLSEEGLETGKMGSSLEGYRSATPLIQEPSDSVNRLIDPHRQAPVVTNPGDFQQRVRLWAPRLHRGLQLRPSYRRHTDTQTKSLSPEHSMKVFRKEDGRPFYGCSP